MPTEGLCRLISASLEDRVTVEAVTTTTKECVTVAAVKTRTTSAPPLASKGKKYVESDEEQTERPAAAAAAAGPPSSVALVAYAELLRTVTRTLGKTFAREGYPHHAGEALLAPAWEGVRVMDLRAVIR